jgi:hypothetical protein
VLSAGFRQRANKLLSVAKRATADATQKCIEKAQLEINYHESFVKPLVDKV